MNNSVGKIIQNAYFSKLSRVWNTIISINYLLVYGGINRGIIWKVGEISLFFV